MANTIQKAAVFGNTSAEARRRVIGLYRAWYRDVSTCASTEWQVLLLGPTKYHCPLPLLLTAAFDTCVSFGPRLRTIKLLLCPPRVRALTKPKQRKKLFLAQGIERKRGEREKHHADQSVSRELSFGSSFRIHAHCIAAECRNEPDVGARFLLFFYRLPSPASLSFRY